MKLLDDAMAPGKFPASATPIGLWRPSIA